MIKPLSYALVVALIAQCVPVYAESTSTLIEQERQDLMPVYQESNWQPPISTEELNRKIAEAEPSRSSAGQETPADASVVDEQSPLSMPGDPEVEMMSGEDEIVFTEPATASTVTGYDGFALTLIGEDIQAEGSDVLESGEPQQPAEIFLISTPAPEDKPAQEPAKMTWEELKAQLPADLLKLIEGMIAAGVVTTDGVAGIFNTLDAYWQAGLVPDIIENDKAYISKFVDALKALGVDLKGADKGKSLTKILGELRAKKLTKEQKLVLAGLIFDVITTQSIYEGKQYDPAKITEGMLNCTAFAIVYKYLADLAGLNVQLVDVQQAGPDKTPHAMAVYIDPDGKKYYIGIGGTFDDMRLEPKLPADMIGVTEGLGGERASSWILQWKAIEIHEQIKKELAGKKFTEAIKSPAVQDLLKKMKSYLDQIAKTDPGFLKDKITVALTQIVTQHLVLVKP